MDDVKIKVIDSDKLVKAIKEGSYDVNLSAVLTLGAVMLDNKKQKSCKSSDKNVCKKGKWIKNNNGTYTCSLCQSWIPEEQYHYARYCLYCGADMRGEQDENY